MAFTGLMSTRTSAPKVCLSALLRPGLEACLVELPVKNGPLELIQFPGVFIMLRKTETPVEPPAGAIVNHFGFTVSGRLVEFHSIPLQVEAPVTGASAPDWAQLFDAAGLSMASFHEAVPQWTPRGIADVRRAWEGPLPDIPGIKAWYVKAFGANARARGSAAFPVRP